MAIKSFDYVNYSKVFRTQVPQSNLLLTHLNVFADRQIADSHKVSMDRIQEASIGVDAPLMRFSSEWGTIEKPTAGSYLYELPWSGVTDRVTSADLKGYRKPGSTMEQSLDEIEANKFLQMRAKFERSREYAYWQVLIFNKVNGFGTQQSEIDWSLEFSLNRRQADLHQDVNDDPMRDIDDQVSATKALMGGLTQYLRGWVLLCGSDAYRAVRYHPQIRELLVYSNGLVGSDVLFPSDVLPGFSSFMLGSVRLIECSDSAFTGVKSDQAFLVPVFGNAPVEQSLPMGRFIGPCARHLEISASGDVEDWYAFRSYDELRNRNLYSEYSLLAYNFRPDLITRMTLVPVE
ncbi:TPA: major capsid protein [Klebsiella pneumoniae]